MSNHTQSLAHNTTTTWEQRAIAIYILWRRIIIKIEIKFDIVIVSDYCYYVPAHWINPSFYYNNADVSARQPNNRAHIQIISLHTVIWIYDFTPHTYIGQNISLFFGFCICFTFVWPLSVWRIHKNPHSIALDRLDWWNVSFYRNLTNFLFFVFLGWLGLFVAVNLSWSARELNKFCVRKL